MNRTMKNRLVCAAALLIVLASSAESLAWRPGRRAGRVRENGTSGLKAVAPKSDPAASGYRPLQAHFHYDPALADEVAFTDRLRVFVRVSDPEVLRISTPIVAEVKLTDLAHESEPVRQFCPISWQVLSDQERLAVFDVANRTGAGEVVSPERVYRIFVNLHRQNEGDQNEGYGARTVLGHVPLPYYAATAGDTRLSRARQHIAMRTFREFYFAQHGWESEEYYPMDCYAYYMWATGSVTSGAQNRRTVLDRLFGVLHPFRSGREIPEIARQEAIHGDYVRIPGHSFMLLAHDADAGHVWTMEGNFNGTIEIVVRSPDTGWTIGHLVDDHIQPELFQVSRAAAPGAPARL